MDITIFLIAVSLAIDCFAVSICIASSKKEHLFSKFEAPVFFAFFQFFMTLIGYYLSFSFKNYIDGFDHWIAFTLLLIIGIKMIKESLENKCETIGKLTLKRLIALSIATSIDALVIGIALSMIDGGILVKALIIGLVSLVLSLLGIFIGKKIKSFEMSFIEIIGGLVLIGIGIKVLISHIF
ncbi:manganese efflux pump MntP [uncultured archaeon]|nr:manganese efflux pump MntP [uncultured archaeon]